MKDSMVLSQRYGNDGEPILKLNALQVQMKEQIEQKIADGTYHFEEVPCAVCDAQNFELLAQKDRYGLYLPVVICNECGLIQTNPRMDQNAYNEFYNAEYRELYGGEESPTEEFFQTQRYQGRRIFRYLQQEGLLPPAGSFILEVGCGAGGILHYFKEEGYRVRGIDLGASYVAYGRDQHGLDLSVGMLDDLALETPPDLIIYSHVMEHILTPNDELQKVREVLPDAGLLYIEIPGVKNLMHSYELDFLRLLQNAHVYHFTLRSLQNLAAKNGFELLIGNESVNSVFRKSEVSATALSIESDCADALAYLEMVEKRRTAYPLSPAKVARVSKNMVTSTLKSVGLLDSVRDMYRRIKTR